MGTAEHRRGTPHPVTTLAGVLVALVAAVFGVCAHGLAAGSAGSVPPGATLLQVLAGSALLGAATASCARRLPLLPVAATGLLAGQAVTHLVLVLGHTGHGAASHAAHIGVPGAAHAESAAIRAAMDGAAAESAAHGAVHAGAGMLVAHLGAVALTVLVLALASGMLAWLAARVAPLLARVYLPAHAVVTRPVAAEWRPALVHLVARGGTRAPPLPV